MDEVESVADDDERELVLELRLLEEVLDFLGVVVVTLATDTLDFPDLACTRGRLDVLEVHLRVGTEINNGAKVIVETFKQLAINQVAKARQYIPSKVLKLSNISINDMGPRMSEYLVAI